MILREIKMCSPGASFGKQMEVDSGSRMIQGYFATWDLDRIGDTIDRRAFEKTINERGPRYDGETFLGSDIKIDYNHDIIVGVPLKLGTDDVGAYYEGRIQKTIEGDRVLARIANQDLDVNSFVFDTLDFEPVKGASAQKIQGGYEVVHRRHLTELRLHAAGPVDGACNEAARMKAQRLIQAKHYLDGFSRQELGTWCDELVWNYSRDIKAGRAFSEGDLLLLDAAISRLSEIRKMAGEPDEPEPEPEEAEAPEDEDPKGDPEPTPPVDDSSEDYSGLVAEMQSFREKLKGIQNGY